jgi:hypothetical protein
VPDVVSVLGHELQRALEIAAAPEVRDLATQVAPHSRLRSA